MSELRIRIKEVRGSDSQKEAARKSGISQQQWSKLELGKIDVDDTSVLPKIVNAYPAFRLEWLVTGALPKFSPYAASEAPASVELLAERRARYQINLQRIIDASERAGPTFDTALDKIAGIVEFMVTLPPWGSKA